MSYQPDDKSLPPIEDQEMPSGRWIAGNPMFWVGTNGAGPQGPVVPQVHDEGQWVPSSGGYMQWAPTTPVEAPSPVIEIVAGDEEQPPEEEATSIGVTPTEGEN